jgi:hypothetical protein
MDRYFNKARVRQSQGAGMPHKGALAIILTESFRMPTSDSLPQRSR